MTVTTWVGITVAAVFSAVAFFASLLLIMQALQIAPVEVAHSSGASLGPYLSIAILIFVGAISGGYAIAGALFKVCRN